MAYTVKAPPPKKMTKFDDFSIKMANFGALAHNLLKTFCPSPPQKIDVGSASGPNEVLAGRNKRCKANRYSVVTLAEHMQFSVQFS